MADNTQDKIDQFNDELGKISDRIVDLGGVLGVNLAGKLQDAINEARKMSDPLKDAASISKKMNDLADKNETLIIKKRIAEEQGNLELVDYYEREIKAREETKKKRQAILDKQ